MASLKRFRSVVHKVKESRLYENLKAVHLADPNPAYKWDGSFCGKGKGPNEHAILTEAVPVLAQFVIEASNGFPDGRGMRRVLIALHAKFKIFDNSKILIDKGEIGCGMDAADNWKKMLSDVVSLKRANASVADPKLQALIDSVVPDMPSDSPRTAVPSLSPRSDDAQIPLNQDGYPDFEAMDRTSVQQDIDDDVIFLKTICRCKGCTGVSALQSDGIAGHVKPQFGQLVGHVKGPHVAAATGAAAEQQRSESSKEHGDLSMTGSSGDDDDMQMTVRPPATHAIAHDSSSRYDHVSTKRQLTMQDSIGGEDLHVPSCQKGGQKTPAAEKKKNKIIKETKKAAPATLPAQSKSPPRARKTPPWRTSAPQKDGEVQRDESKEQDDEPLAVHVPKLRLLKKTSPPLLLRNKLKLRRQVCATTCYCQLVAPFRMRCRRKPARLQQRYILDGKQKYVGGCAITMSPKFDEIMNTVLESLNDRTLTCKLQVHQTIMDMVKKAKEQA